MHHRSLAHRALTILPEELRTQKPPGRDLSFQVSKFRQCHPLSISRKDVERPDTKWHLFRSLSMLIVLVVLERQ